MMRTITLFKTLLVAIALVILNLSVSAQESIIYSTGFESSQSFTATTSNTIISVPALAAGSYTLRVQLQGKMYVLSLLKN